MSRNIYLIQGIFFQIKGRLVPEMDSNGDVIATIRKGMCDYMFSGVLEIASNSVSEGETNDVFGEAELTNLVLTDNELRFTKKYAHRPDLIQYTFKKREDGTWVGNYTGDETGYGDSRCVLVPVSEDFFRSPPIF